VAEQTHIGWTDHTRNFWEGCTEAGPGCDGCYAKARDVRFHGGKHWGPGAPRLEHLKGAANDVMKWNRQAAADGIRRRIFINTLSDFFDNEVPQGWRNYALDALVKCEWLDVQLLTKRIGNVPNMVPIAWMSGAWPRNIWIGATIVNQTELDRDGPKVLSIPAPVRFVSYEPALGPVDWDRLLWRPLALPEVPGHALNDGCSESAAARKGLWIIVGGESDQRGHEARIFDLAWARSTIKQCRQAAVPVFVKQLGSYPVSERVECDGDGNYAAHLSPEHPAGRVGLVLRDRAGADPAEWPADLRVQEFPA
jgi:protein gp37